MILCRNCRETSELSICRISDGNLNFALRVVPEEDRSQSIIFKYSAPYLMTIGSHFPLSPDRGKLEYTALDKFHTICPGCVPKPLVYSKKHFAFCMEDLRDYTIYRKWLLAGNVDEDVARKLARELGLIHCHTHVTKIGQAKLRQLDREFHDTDVTMVTDNFLFNSPLTPDMPSNRWPPLLDEQVEAMQDDEELLRLTKKMQMIFHEKKEALIHGNLHTGSAMVKGKDIRICDVEFAMVGPCAMDLGLLLANYIFSYYHHMLNPTDNHSHREVAQKILDICYATADEYLKHMTCSAGEREQYVNQLMSETAGFAGCEIIRRLLGAEHVEDMDDMESAQPDALSAGCRLLRAQHRIHNIHMMMNIALMLTT